MKNKYMKSVFALLTAVSIATITACSSGNSTAQELRPNPDMVLKLEGSGSIVNNGGVAKPWSNINFATSKLWRNLFLATAGTLDVEYDLAESHTISDDGLTYEIVLKDGIVWDDGEPVNVEDVVFSIESLLLLSTTNTVYTMFTAAFSDIVGADEFLINPDVGLSGLTTSDNKIIINLKNPNNLFLQTLSQFTILPEHGFTGIDPTMFHESDVDFWLNPIFNGMYTMGDHVSGEYLEYKYNETYVGEAPYISILRYRKDYELADLSYSETNDVSLILDNRAVSSNTEHIADSTFYRYFVYNIDKGGELDPVLNDERVRRAFTHAIDREAIVNKVYYGIGEINNTGAVQEYDSPIDVDYEYDPEKALALLQEAEYDFDRPVTLLYYYSDDISIKFMDEVGKYLEAIGLKVEILKGTLYVEEFDHYDMGLKGLAVYSIVDWYNEYLSSSQLFKDVYGSSQEPLFDDLIIKLNQATTEDERVETLIALQELEYELLYKYPVFIMGHMAYTSNDVILPDGVNFGDSKYRYDLNFENWQINN